jgi:hypothetical protein
MICIPRLVVYSPAGWLAVAPVRKWATVLPPVEPPTVLGHQDDRHPEDRREARDRVTEEARQDIMRVMIVMNGCG